MATNRFLGHAPAIAQVVTLVVGSTTSGHTFVTTINGKSISYEAGSGETTSTIAAAIQALLADSTIPEFAEVTWTVDTATVTGTAAVPGVPFTVSKSGTGTYTLTTVTSSSGPNDVSVASNWSQGTLPAATEDVLVDLPVDMLWGWASITAEAYASLRVKASAECRVGLPYWNPNGYVEYRTRSWAVADAVPVTIGEGDGNGPLRVNLNQTTAAAITVHKTGRREDPAVPVVNVYGSASGTVTVASGDVGVAADDDTTSGTVTTLNADNDAVVTVGKGATVTTANLYANATLNGYGTVTTLNATGGAATLYAAATTLTLDGGVADLRFTGTVTTVTARGQPNRPAPRVECGNAPRARTFTNCSFTGGAVLWDPDKTVTFTNAGTWDHASLMASHLGERLTIQRT